MKGPGKWSLRKKYEINEAVLGMSLPGKFHRMDTGMSWDINIFLKFLLLCITNALAYNCRNLVILSP